MPAIITNSKEEIPTFKGIDELPQNKTKNGYLYELVKRNHNVAMYSQKNKSNPEDTSTGYEVFKIVLSKPCAIQQKSGAKAGMWYHYPTTEKFPGNEDFGKSAFAFNKKEFAEAKYEELS